MKKALISMCLAVMVFFGGKGFAQNEGVLDKVVADYGLEFSGDLAFNSIYMWRGIMLDGDPVVQPGFYVSTKDSKLGKLKLGFWMSRDMENKDLLKSSETDYIIDYTYSFKDMAVSVGHTYYDFPDALPLDGASRGFSREFYTGLSFPNIFFAPSVYYYYDYGKKEDGGGQGSYTVLNLAYSLPVKIKEYACSLDISSHIGHNNKQYYASKGGDAALGAGLTIPFAKNLNCKPNINYSVPWGNVSDKGAGNQKNRFYSGIYLSYSF
jgi:hypothetical protein